MVRAKLEVYYTFKPAKMSTQQEGEIAVVECHKWEEATGEHLEVYRVRPHTDWMACSCPAYRRCKHMKCVDDMIATGKIAEPWKWRWDEKQGWQKLDDIPEEVQL